MLVPLECGLVVRDGVDVFGKKPDVNAVGSFECIHCRRNVVASRFAPHLEKCMGIGKFSGRAARRKLAQPAPSASGSAASLTGTAIHGNQIPSPAERTDASSTEENDLGLEEEDDEDDDDASDASYGEKKRRRVRLPA